MLRYDRQTKPGLVALYNIRPGNGVGPFLQPRSPHGASDITDRIHISDVKPWPTSGLIMRPRWARMSDSLLETVMYLKCNSDVTA